MANIIEITSFDDLNNYTGSFPLEEKTYAQSVARKSLQ